MTELEKVGRETVVFMRGKYCLDEAGDGDNELKFKQGKKTVLTIYIHEDKYTFLIIFGKVERGMFETVKDEFSQYIQSYYDSSKTYHDGKWMFIDVTTLEVLEEIKKLIMLKKKPNRKPFPKESAVYARCGMRCDLCVHYSGGTISDEKRGELKKRVDRIYYGGIENSYDLCPGCSQQLVGKPHPCMGGDSCKQLKCANEKGFLACTDCPGYQSCRPVAGYELLESRSMLADDVTWAILPYVPYQYGN
ncbi:MAG TPA: hypothetical protein DHD79_04485 [Firmicutes bacterium]|nr:hypothetical protein [Bacillota bacterium]HAW70348.1 hypothetical protein [Bacillota bacterium]HAZ21097.1 hypothetical protein [Bacillota bacterium]HBE05482.1 hypothetical protein [Bacillota bacterium]HBG45144.1 hypothetical protein [Bacillota bacterium]